MCGCVFCFSHPPSLGLFGVVCFSGVKPLAGDAVWTSCCFALSFCFPFAILYIMLYGIDTTVRKSDKVFAAAEGRQPPQSTPMQDLHPTQGQGVFVPPVWDAMDWKELITLMIE